MAQWQRVLNRQSWIPEKPATSWLSREGNGTPLQYSCLENPMDGGAWWAAVHGVAKSRTRLSDFTFVFHFHALEKAMATHSSVLAWRIPGTGEPGGLPSIGSHRVGHDWSDLAQQQQQQLAFEVKNSVITTQRAWLPLDKLFSFPSGQVATHKCLPAKKSDTPTA